MVIRVYKNLIYSIRPLLINRSVQCGIYLMVSVAAWCLPGWRFRHLIYCCLTNLQIIWTWRQSTLWLMPSMTLKVDWCLLVTTLGLSIRCVKNSEPTFGNCVSENYPLETPPPPPNPPPHHHHLFFPNYLGTP